MYRDLFMTEEEELKARIEAAKKDLSFFSLYWDDICLLYTSPSPRDA